MPELSKGGQRCVLNRLDQLLILENGPQRQRLLRLQPSTKTMPRWIQTQQFVQKPVHEAILAVLELLEVLPHPIRRPGLVAADIDDILPIDIAWIHEDLRVVRRAAAQSSGTGI